MAEKKNSKSKTDKQSELDKLDELIERFNDLVVDARLSIRKLEEIRRKAERPNRIPTLKSVVREVEILKASPGDLVILAAKPAALDKLQAILDKYAPAFTARGLEVMVTDGSCEVRRIVKDLAGEE